MSKDLLKLLNLYNKLLIVIEKEGDEQTNYAKNILSSDIEDLENLSEKDRDLNEIFKKLKKRYDSLYPVRGGLSEFFIWREDFDARVSENEKLNDLKKAIEDIFKKNY